MSFFNMQIKNIILGIAIIILTIFVTVYGINIFYPSGEYKDYCKDDKIYEIADTQQKCEDLGGKWRNYEFVKENDSVEGYCDRDYFCRQEYDSAREIRAKKIFFISVPLGVIIIIFGGFLFHLEAVGAGLMGGGVGTIVYGSGNYWQYGDNLFKFILSLLGLTAVIYSSYWLNKKFEKKK